VLEPTVLRKENVPVFVLSSYNGSDFHVTNASTSIETSPAILYYSTQMQDPPSLPGVDVYKGLVVPDFEPLSGSGENVKDMPILPPGTKYTARVPGAGAFFECEYFSGLNATGAQLPWFGIEVTHFIMNITTPSCNLTNVIVGKGPYGGM
jgi:hypothetical protein